MKSIEYKFLFSVLCIILLNFPVLGFLDINFKNLFLLPVKFLLNPAYSAEATTIDKNENDADNDNENEDDNDNEHKDKSKHNSKGNPNSPLCSNGRAQCPKGTAPRCMGADAMNIPTCFEDESRAKCCDLKGKCTSEKIVCVEPGSDTTEKPQCSDGIDNDSDGAIDFPADFSCSSSNDDNEGSKKAQCQDGRDNDNDGLIDFPKDSDCNSNQDNNEATSSGENTATSGGTTSGNFTTTSSGTTSTSSGGTTSSTTSSGTTSTSNGGATSSTTSGGTTISSSGTATTSGGLGIDAASLTIDVLSTPKLPDIIQLPLVRDEFLGKIGFAYRGSNPSFEIRTRTILTSKITSADIIDKSGTVFANIPFSIFEIPGSQDTLILGLTLPDSLAVGETRFILHVENGESLTGLIDVLDFLDVKTPHSIKTKKIIEKPVISRLKSHTETSHKIKLRLRGDSFVGRRVVFEENGVVQFLIRPRNDPNTSVTVYPRDLNLELRRSSVVHNRKIMRIRLRSTEKITTPVNAVLVIATPRGIVSKEFTIRPKVKRH